MNSLSDIYRTSLALLTDLYELTMAAGYLKAGKQDTDAVFNLFFRVNPFGGGYVLACGLGTALEFLENFRYTGDDLDYLAELRDGRGGPLFERAFLDYLGELELTVDIDAVPEGTPTFPGEPLVRVKGPLLQCQILETALLTIVNFQTLIATKASRVVGAASGDPVLEFGLRRAQGPDGGLSAARAAYIGGCAGTSNVLAGKLYGIPVRGTHAHSWVMAFDSEEQAFEAWTDVMPANSIFLVDTYDTLEGVGNAIRAGRHLRERGYELAGIRLDSGDLAGLSVRARAMLDEAGFARAVIVGSSDLDEYAIRDLKKSGAPIHMWGVGTRLVTGGNDPALGGVYKLVAVRSASGEWNSRIKMSEEDAKRNLPGMLQVLRFSENGVMAGDMIYDEARGPGEGTAIHLLSDGVRRELPADGERRDLLVPIWRSGASVYTSPAITMIRDTARRALDTLPEACRRLDSPEAYPVGVDPGLWDRMERHASKERSRNGDRENG